MKKLIIASALALVSATAVNAQSTGDKGAGMKLSQAECESLWAQANPSNAATISQKEAQPFVSDFKAANPDGDGTLDKNEFSMACGKGLVKGSSGSTGAGSGAEGSSGSMKKPY